VSFHQCSILIHLFIQSLHSFIHSSVADAVRYVHCCHIMWKNLKREIPVCCLFQTWKLNTCCRIIHQASGSTGWKILLNVLLSCGVFELGICLQQTHGGLCHLVGSHNVFFKGKRVSFSLLLKICFPAIWREVLYTCSERSCSQSWILKLSYTFFQSVTHIVY